FTHHFFFDVRWIFVFMIIWAFRKTDVHYTPNKIERQMPLLLGFILIGFFIWLAENIATFFNAWKYPNQYQAWHLVSFSKISSWFLLVIISVIIVAQLKHIKANRITINS